MFKPFLRRLVIGLMLLSAAATFVQAQTSDDLFNEGVVHTLQITIHTRDWDTLRANFTSNDFYPADVTWNGLRVRNVGIRSRGLGSRSGVKPGLELNFAHYSSRGQFLGHARAGSRQPDHRPVDDPRTCGDVIPASPRRAGAARSPREPLRQRMSSRASTPSSSRSTPCFCSVTSARTAVRSTSTTG